MIFGRRNWVADKVAAGFVGVDVTSVRLLANEGKIDSRRKGATLMVDINQVEALFGHSRQTRHHEHEPVGA